MKEKVIYDVGKQCEECQAQARYMNEQVNCEKCYWYITYLKDSHAGDEVMLKDVRD